MDLFQKMFDPDWVECPHCNGYGSSLKEDAPKCTKCFGDGLVHKKTLHEDRLQREAEADAYGDSQIRPKKEG